MAKAGFWVCPWVWPQRHGNDGRRWRSLGKASQDNPEGQVLSEGGTTKMRNFVRNGNRVMEYWEENGLPAVHCPRRSDGLLVISRAIVSFNIRAIEIAGD